MSGDDAEGEMDQELYDKLRDLRKAMAQASGVAPYMVFADKSLAAMATQKPTTQAEFSTVYGVGKVKCQKYWRSFTAVIAQHLQQQ